MGVGKDVEAVLTVKFQAIFPHLDERQRRLLAGAEASALGHGGIRVVAQASGLREGTVSDGVRELESGAEPLGRVRGPGGGRKRLVDLDPGLRPALLALVEPDERGDPMSPLRWTTKSTRNLAGKLTAAGHHCGADTVAGLLHEEGFSLQGNAKTLEGKRHPDRDAQFRYINEQVKAHQAAGQPVVSVDAKKKELIGNFGNAGLTWRPAASPILVSSHDFPDSGDGKAVPYGVYDLARNTGWVSVGVDHDTAEFAVASIRRWWEAVGADAWPGATRLLITADAGGSNGHRSRLWKTELAAFAQATGLTVTVCHFPPGTSKFNKIEHRLFSHITMNWRGRPLTSHEVVVQSIAATTTRTGLAVRAELDTATYPAGILISDAELAGLPLDWHDWHDDWNYTLRPEPATATAPRTFRKTRAPKQPRVTEPTTPESVLLREPEHPEWAHPSLTGMTAQAWNDLVTALRQPRLDLREAELDAQGVPAARRRAGGRRPVLTIGEEILATALATRHRVQHKELAVLFATDGGTIGKAVRRINTLFDQHGQRLAYTGPDLWTLQELIDYATDNGLTLTPKIKPAS